MTLRRPDPDEAGWTPAAKHRALADERGLGGVSGNMTGQQRGEKGREERVLATIETLLPRWHPARNLGRHGQAGLGISLVRYRVTTLGGIERSRVTWAIAHAHFFGDARAAVAAESD